MNHEWVDRFHGAMTVCDRRGVIVEMNERARATFGPDRELVGTNVLDCHPEPARTKLAGLLATGGTNAYTIEKNGVRKLIYKAPWYRDGEYAGLVELSLVIPAELPHHVRA